MALNCVQTEWNYIKYVCGIWLGIGEGANAIISKYKSFDWIAGCRVVAFVLQECFTVDSVTLHTYIQYNFYTITLLLFNVRFSALYTVGHSVSRLSRFPSSSVGRKWPSCIEMPVLHIQSVNQSINYYSIFTLVMCLNLTPVITPTMV